MPFPTFDFGTHAADKALQPLTIECPDFGLHMARHHWGRTQYPVVPGLNAMSAATRPRNGHSAR